MYWGKNNAQSQSDGTLVFDVNNNFAGVWHLDEEVFGFGNPDVYKDATSNVNHGIDNITAAYQEEVIGPSHDFNGQWDHIEIPRSSSTDKIQEGSYTISAWYKADVIPSNADTDYENFAILMKEGYHEGIVFKNTSKFEFHQQYMQHLSMQQNNRYHLFLNYLFLQKRFCK